MAKPFGHMTNIESIVWATWREGRTCVGARTHAFLLASHERRDTREGQVRGEETMSLGGKT